MLFFIYQSSMADWGNCHLAGGVIQNWPWGNLVELHYPDDVMM